MLDLNNPIVYNAQEQSIIATVMASAPDGAKRWNDSRTKAIKHRISVSCLREQNCRCAYCECYLRKGSAPIEHISPKSSTPEFVYEPNNLVVSCTSCNSTAIKGEKPTIYGDVDSDYSHNTFIIVHPRLDNPDDHIVFLNSERIVFDFKKCNPKGLFTIDFFHWNDENAIASRILMSRGRNLDLNIEKMIIEISTYKPAIVR